MNYSVTFFSLFSIILSKKSILIVSFLYFKSKFFVSKSQIFRRNKTRKENIDSLPDRHRHSYDTVSTWLTVETTYKIWKIIENRQVMFYTYNVCLWSQKTSNHSCCSESLFNIQIRTRFIKHIYICLLHTCECNNQPLQFSSRQLPNLSSKNIL